MDATVLGVALVLFFLAYDRLRPPGRKLRRGALSRWANLAVDVQDVSKRFRLYHEKYTSLKEKVIHAGRTPYEDLWALNDVSFEVKEGETVGILGRNGSGKSTLLKCICGVLQPTAARWWCAASWPACSSWEPGSNRICPVGRTSTSTARCSGLSKREVDRLFDDIVEFAELEQFIDNQVKFYSSGMYVRLGFAVAVNVDPDVLVVDEVLAVGDERFQRKCMDRIKLVPDRGPDDPLRLPLAGPGAGHLRPGGGAQRRADDRPGPARRSGAPLPRDPARGGRHPHHLRPRPPPAPPPRPDPRRWRTAPIRRTPRSR